MPYTGIDGCRYGWILMKSDHEKIRYGGIYSSLDDLLREHNDLGRVFIDMPMGLSEQGHIRTVDGLLRKQLGARHSTVFNAPCRAALWANSYEEAKAINISIEGKSLSKQTYFISAKIAELDAVLQRDRQMHNRFIESHPELCFKYLNSGQVLDSKSTATGLEQRITLLSKYYPKTETLYQDVLRSTKRKQVKADDIIDAICLCLVNRLCGENQLSFIEDPLQADATGIPMRIGYYDSV